MEVLCVGVKIVKLMNVVIQADRCVDSDCSDYPGGWSEKWKKTTPHSTPPLCAGTTCRTNDTECCERRQKCSSYSCPTNYREKTKTIVQALKGVY